MNQDLAAQVQRSRAAVAASAQMQARATAAMAGAVTIVTAVATRYGHLLRAERIALVSGLEQVPISRIFTAAGVSAGRRLVSDAARDFGLSDDGAADFVLAVQELMTNAIRHGGGWGRMTLHRAGDVLMCSVTDHGPGFSSDPRQLGGLPSIDSEGGRGLWLARQLTDNLRIITGPAGVKVTVTVKRPATA